MLHSFIFLLTVIFLNPKVLSATHPLTGSSLINQPNSSWALTQLGFKLNNIPQDWVYNKSIDSSAKSIELGMNNKTLLSFRLENVSVKTQLEQYVRQYLRDYHQYGFDIIGLHSQKNGTGTIAVVDLKQKNNSAKSRQVFFHNQDKIIIATCADNATQFDNTAAICNQILNSFQWR